MKSRFSNSHLSGVANYSLVAQDIWENPEKVNLKLDWNEGTLEMPAEFIERIEDFLHSDRISYYPNLDLDNIRENMGIYLGRKKEQIDFFSGSDHAHEVICRAFLSLGDRVLIVGPTYDNFRLNAEISGCEIDIANVMLDVDPIASLLSKDWKDYKLLYMSNPNNPTGKLIDIEKIETLLRRFRDTLVFVDEAYIDFSGLDCSGLVDRYDNLIISRTLSKAASMANLRIGYSITCEENSSILQLVKNPKSFGTIQQIAVDYWLQNRDYFDNYIKQVVNVRDDIQDWFYTRGVSHIPSQGNFILLLCQTEVLRDNLFHGLYQRGIYSRRFGGTLSHCLRISIPRLGQKQDLLDAFDELL